MVYLLPLLLATPREPPSARRCKWMRLRRLVDFGTRPIALPLHHPLHRFSPDTRKLRVGSRRSSREQCPSRRSRYTHATLTALVGARVGRRGEGSEQCPSRRSREAIRRTPPSLRFSPRHSQAWGIEKKGLYFSPLLGVGVALMRRYVFA